MNTPHRRRGLSLVEMVMSLGLVGLLMVSALSTVASTARHRTHGFDQPIADILAQDLMAEIMLKAYEEPFETLQFGPETSETGGDRSAFDDVDDYHGWSSSPPESSSGVALPGRVGWTRSVTVSYRQSSSPSLLVGSDSGLKAITVTVLHNGRTVSELTALRTESWSWPFD